MEAGAESGLATLHSSQEIETGSEVRLHSLKTLPQFLQQGRTFTTIWGPSVHTRDEGDMTFHTQITTLGRGITFY